MSEQGCITTEKYKIDINYVYIFTGGVLSHSSYTMLSTSVRLGISSNSKSLLSIVTSYFSQLYFSSHFDDVDW